MAAWDLPLWNIHFPQQATMTAITSSTLPLFMHALEGDEDDYELNSMISDQIGRVEIGVSDIDDVAPVASQDVKLAEANCPVCMSEFKELLDDEINVRRTLCGHEYCDPCAQQWFKGHKRCPVCTTDVEDMLHAEPSKYAQAPNVQ
jgi:hypothetical protein